jgi:hypothetical protein
MHSMLPVVIEQVRDVTKRRINGPTPERPRPRPMRRTFAVLLTRAARRLDPCVTPQPRIEAA